MFGTRPIFLTVSFCVLWYQSVPLYLSEMAPAQYRGALNILFQFAITLGILVANIINFLTSTHKHGWRYSLGLAVVPALMLICGSFFLPDTPNSLIERGHLAEGKAILQKIRGVENVDVEFEDIVEASDLANQVFIRLMMCFWVNVQTSFVKKRDEIARAIWR